MISVFGAFMLGDNPVIKMFGFGMAFAVFIDATIVRMVLVPATMELLGDRELVAPGVARPDHSPTSTSKASTGFRNPTT